MCDYNVYMAKDSSTTQSYLITLLDGTGSMRREYHAIVDAHNYVFDSLGQQQKKCQWEESLYDFLPFKSASLGNITTTFRIIFEQLLNTQNPKNITILFISDGQEPFDLNQLQGLIEKMKQNYLIQFISLAVGQSFPNTISNILRNCIHNQNSSCPALFEYRRRNAPYEEIKEEFINIFQKIKQLLCVKANHFQLNQPVYQTIASKKTTMTVAPGEPFIQVNDGSNQKIILEGEELKPTVNPVDISQLISNSVQQKIIETAANQESNYAQSFQEMKTISLNLLSKIVIDKDKDEIKQEDVQLVTPLLDIIDNFSNGNLKVENLNQQKMTLLQQNMKEKNEMIKFIDTFSTDCNRVETQTQKKVEEKIKLNLNKTKLGCYARSTVTNKPLDLVQSIWSIISQGLIDYKTLILQDQTLNIKLLLKEFKNILDQNLEKIFKFEKFEKLNEKNKQILRKLNQILQKITQLLSQVKPITTADLINIIDYSQSFDVEKFEIEPESKNQDQEYECLPKCIQPIQFQNVRTSYIATYALLVLGGNKSPTMNDIAHVLKVADIQPDEMEIEYLIFSLKDKDLKQIIDEGKLKMLNFS